MGNNGPRNAFGRNNKTSLGFGWITSTINNGMSLNPQNQNAKTPLHALVGLNTASNAISNSGNKNQKGNNNSRVFRQDTGFNPLTLIIQPNGNGGYDVLRQSYGHNPQTVRSGLPYNSSLALVKTLMRQNPTNNNVKPQKIGGK